MGHTLRYYQDDGVDAGMKVMTAKSKKGIVVQPTGAGKSHIVAEIVKRLPDTPIVVLQPTKELLKQNYSKYVKIGGKASIYCSSLKKKIKNKKMYTEINGEDKRCDEISRVTYATIGSIKKELPKLIKMGVKHIIVDEIHLQSKIGSQMRQFIKGLKATNVLGLTATPIYLEGGMAGSRLVMINRSFGTMFRDIVQVTQIHELVNAKPNPYWTPFVYKIIKGDDSNLKLNTSGSDYTEYSQKQYYESNRLKEQIVEEVKRLKKEGRKRILIFVPTIDEANQLYGLIPNSAVVHSKMSVEERDFMVEAFTTGDIPVAINCLDKETEILTKRGWVTHSNISLEDQVANWDNGNIYFEKPNKLIKKNIEKGDKMISYESNSVNFRVTDNHNMLLKWSAKSDFKKEEAKQIKGRKLFLPIAGQNSLEDFKIKQEIPKNSYKKRLSANTYNFKKHNIDLTHEECKKIAKIRLDERLALRYKNPSELTIEDCALIGFFTGDGSISSGRFVMSQSKVYPRIIEKIQDILKKTGYGYNENISKPCKNCKNETVKWTFNTGTGFGNQKKNGIYPIIPYLSKNGDYIEYFNKEQFEAFLEGFWLADGNHLTLDREESSKRGKHIHNTNKDLLEKIQIQCVLNNIKCTFRKELKPRKENHKQIYSIRYNKNVTQSLINNRFKVKEEISKGELVWCVNTSSGNIITRRKGRIVVMGNCNVLATGYDNPEIDAIITSRPTSSIAIFYQQIGRGCRLHKDKKDCIIVDFSGNTSRFGRVEELTFEEIPYYGWGLWNGKGELLSDYPIMTKIKPTKQTLMEAGKREYEEKNRQLEKQKDSPEFWFGKHNGITVEQVCKKDKNYLVWIVNQFTKGEWEFKGAKGEILKNHIFKELNLPMPKKESTLPF